MAEDVFGAGHAYKPLLLIVIVILLAFVALGIFRVGSSPEIAITPGMTAIGKRTPVKIEISEPRRGVKHVKVEFFQGEKIVTLADKNYQCSSQFWWGSKTNKAIVSVEVGRQALSELAEGVATIRVTADRAGTWLRNPTPIVEEKSLPVRLTPPSLHVNSTQTYVAQGGCEVVVYKVGEIAVRDGVRAGKWWFPGYPLPGGDKQDRFAFFSVPYNMNQPDVWLVAQDAVENEAQIRLIGSNDKFYRKLFKADTIEITDAFIEKVVPEIMPQSPELKDRGNPLDNYLTINRELRQKDSEMLQSLAQKSQPAFLWNKPFLRLPNSKVMASFGQQRTYRYQGREIDHQDHLGFDLAVTKQYPVPASNDGVIAFARFFGIYGNAIVIDHGYGLQSIYGHLSSIEVTEGQKVARGDIIGKTGQTGLAAGDHLHFCTLLQGLPVDPMEWWDGHWIKDRIARKLGSAFPFAQ
jgi:murein DD-endopeptidase MepM/ murein hydrolase activator NlpD